jgi:hypothetical protein
MTKIERNPTEYYNYMAIIRKKLIIWATEIYFYAVYHTYLQRTLLNKIDNYNVKCLCKI